MQLRKGAHVPLRGAPADQASGDSAGNPLDESDVAVGGRLGRHRLRDRSTGASSENAFEIRGFCAESPEQPVRGILPEEECRAEEGARTTRDTRSSVRRPWLEERVWTEAVGTKKEARYFRRLGVE